MGRNCVLNKITETKAMKPVSKHFKYSHRVRDNILIGAILWIISLKQITQITTY